ncbi:MAG TPA: sulfite exporter TauE/SafE family protein [Phycisphaerales bacterium]
MDYALVCFTVLVASGLTLVSGFGLGTILMPAFAVFFPLPAAIAATAIVHLANNVFKLVLLGRHADRATLIRFGVPAVLASFAGAALLALLENAAPLTTYSIGTHVCRVTIVKLVIAAIMLGFAALELSPRFSKLEFDRRYQPLGGVLSGFFGGLSGHQGSLRSAFLVRAGLSKESFVATGCVIAVMVDVARLLVYGVDAWRAHAQQARAEGVGFGLIAAACLSAFVGAYMGAKLVRKITIEAVRVVVAGMLAVIAILLGAGMI